ncbi:MAG TPA: hypothetical protein VE733_27245 [Streptosporangiaceae bacterium]|nr:hypothetical protein [Streptosporangiaceae bacterium]
MPGIRNRRERPERPERPGGWKESHMSQVTAIRRDGAVICQGDSQRAG